MKNFAVILVLLFSRLLCADSPKPLLILVSIDGFRWDYLDKFEVKNLKEFAAEGVKAVKLQPVFPSITFPNHYSIVTGLYSESHGIVGNQMYDPKDSSHFSLGDSNSVGQSKWWEGEPIWVTAEKQKVKTATMFWVGSEAEIGGIRPSFWMKYDDHVPAIDRIKKILEWIDLPVDGRPEFVTLYFDSVDSAGHKAGPESAEVKDAALNIDSAIGALKKGLMDRGLWDTSHIIVVSDHGMAEVLARHHMQLPNISENEANILGKGAFVQIWPKRGKEKKVIQQLSKLRHGTVIQKSKIPINFRYSKHSRIAPIILVADEGWYFEKEKRAKQGTMGAHGYAHTLDSMQGIFLARGPQLKKGFQFEKALNIDIYEMMCHILGLKPAANDGKYERISSVFLIP